MSQETGKLGFMRVVPTMMRAGQGKEPRPGQAERAWASGGAVLMWIELELTWCVWAGWSSDWTGSEELRAPTEQHSCHLGPRGWTTHVSPAEIFNILHNLLNLGKRKWQGQSKVFKTFKWCQKTTFFFKWYYPLLWMSFTKICYLLVRAHQTNCEKHSFEMKISARPENLHFSTWLAKISCFWSGNLSKKFQW